MCHSESTLEHDATPLFFQTEMKFGKKNRNPNGSNFHFSVVTLLITIIYTVHFEVFGIVVAAPDPYVEAIEPADECPHESSCRVSV